MNQPDTLGMQLRVTPSPQREQDRSEYLRFTEAGNRLRALAREALVNAYETSPDQDPVLHTFAVPLANHMRQVHEQLATWLLDQAVTAEGLADHYRARLDGELTDVAS